MVLINLYLPKISFYKYQLTYYEQDDRTDAQTEMQRWETLDAQLFALYNVIGNGIKTLDDAFDSLGLDCSQLKGRKLTEWAERERFILENSRTLKRCYKTPFGRGYEWIDNNPNLAVFLFDFGMAFMADAGIFLENNKQVERTPKKSFQNVLLELDAMYWDS